MATTLTSGGKQIQNLYAPKYSASAPLVYPLNAGTLEAPHYILFNINLPAKSSYFVNGSFSAAGPLGSTAAMSQVDYNRSFTNQLGGSTSPLGGTASAGTGIVAGASVGGSVLLKTAGKVPLGKAGTVAGVAAVGGAVVAGAATQAIDVTRKTVRTAQEIKLYVPNNLIQQYVSNYDQLSMTEALGMAGFIAQASQSVGASIQESIQNFFSPNLSPLGGGRTSTAAGGAAAAEAGGALAQSSGAFGSGIDKVILNSYGYVKNPQLEVLFNSPSIREFQFDFKFSPKNQKEADSVIEIIKAFKFHAAPELVQGAGGARYFIPPSEFDISFCYFNSQNPRLFKISTCVCTGVDVNYVTANQFATYYDGTPVEIEMVLKFMETEIIHKALVNAGY